MSDIFLNEIARIILPSGKRLAETEHVQRIQRDTDKLTIVIDLLDAPLEWIPLLDATLKETAQQHDLKCEVVFTQNRQPSTTSGREAKVFTHKAINNVRHVIAVGSGKGGVGKSTTALQLALALQSLGHSVGLLDLDIYGPSLPKLTGIDERPASDENKKIIPHRKFGLQLMSLGFMIDQDQAVIWRGPVVQTAVKQLLHDVAWGESEAPLDFLILDLPPGTGDVQLTLVQKAILDGAVVVSTPQDLALLDARKAVAMFEKVNVPILGIIENMSGLTCPRCQHEFHPFGHEGAQHEAVRLGVPFLGDVPLDLALRLASDQGEPLYYQHGACENDSQISKIYRNIALTMLKNFPMTSSA